VVGEFRQYLNLPDPDACPFWQVLPSPSNYRSAVRCMWVSVPSQINHQPQGNIMPNWCNNNLHVYGPDAEVRRFKGMAVGTSPWDTEDGGKQNVLNFHNLVPIPPEILAADYNDAGFHWERMHWGCKWGARHAVLLDERDGHLHYTFATAWVPPITFFARLAPQWPTLRFLLDYEELSMGFKGLAKVAGHSVEDHCVDL
jgi:hypothetical protein